MAQGTPNFIDCIPVGLRLLEHHPVNGGGSEREQACVLPSAPQATISRLWDFEDFDGGFAVRAGQRGRSAPGTGEATGPQAARTRSKSDPPIPLDTPTI